MGRNLVLGHDWSENGAWPGRQRILRLYEIIRVVKVADVRVSPGKSRYVWWPARQHLLVLVVVLVGQRQGGVLLLDLKGAMVWATIEVFLLVLLSVEPAGLFRVEEGMLGWTPGKPVKSRAFTIIAQ